MASWSDGAEYAPNERPDGFAAPRADPLGEAPPEPSLAEGRPLAPPDAFTPQPGPDLAAIGIDKGPTRNPQQAFATASKAMTTATSSAWGSTHAATITQEAPFNPRAPMVTESSLANLGAPTGEPVQATWTPPGAPAPGSHYGYDPALQYRQPTTRAGQASSVAQTIGMRLTWPLVIALALGALIPQLSIAMLLVAAVLATRIKHKPQAQRLRMVIGISAAAAVLLAFMLDLSQDVVASMGTWARVGSLVSLGYGIWLVWPRRSQQP
ncbi:hypothetical protein ACQCX5_08430 [Propionibacteriaceae bacterium G57]|uniref:hypothetical protein n=1 Tax=Aestuariimicrobium sp. G57 TaxID=3418485 RepID=UPI003DA79FA2